MIMKTMSDYTLYCTPEQTERAYKLGAPIRTFECDNKIARESFIKRFDAIELENIVMGDIPTTQQMRAWLEECHGLYITANPVWNKRPKYRSMVEHEWDFEVIGEVRDFDTPKEAELAAIDAALDYLEKGETK